MDRTRSQSRFPPPFQGSIPEEFPQSTLDRNNRSKSLDNRRAFFSPHSNDSYYQQQNQTTPTISRRRYYGNNSSARDSFFNDAINIPIQKQQQSPRHHRSAIDLKGKENEGEDLWTSYDKTVRYNHEKVNYPSKGTSQQAQYYDGYLRHGGQTAPIIYPESSDYLPRNNTVTYSDAYKSGAGAQHQDAYRGALHQENYRSSAGYHHSDSRPIFDDEYVGDSTLNGRTLIGESTDARQQRGYQYNKQQETSSAQNQKSIRQQQKAATNGYSHSSHHHRRHASAGGGTGGYYSKSYGGYNAGVGPKQIVHHRVRCCCLNFMWPPWGYERCDPPQPIFFTPPNYHGNKARSTTNRNENVTLPPLQPINTAPPTDPNYNLNSPSRRY